MRNLTLSIGIVTLMLLAPAAAQKPQRTAAEMKTAWDAHHGDFDYLLGDWEFTVDSRDFGKGHGFWSAVRLSEGQVLDEFRVVDDAGETAYVTTTVRAYNSERDRWELVGMHQGDGLQNTGTGKRVGNEVHITQRTGSDNGVIITHVSAITTFGRIASRGLRTDQGTAERPGYARRPE